MLTVFIPSTPNPTTGFMILSRRDEVRPLAIGVEEGMKMIVSGGIIAPETLYSAQAA